VYRRVVRRILVILATLARNALPPALVLGLCWDASTAMILYLGENVVAVLLAALTVRLLAPASEVIDGQAKARTESLRTFFLVAGPFSFGAAVIATVVIGSRSEYTLDAKQLTTGLLLMAASQVVGFFTNLRRSSRPTLAEGEQLLVGILGRVFLLAFTVWAGIAVVIFLGGGFFLTFVALKTIIDLTRLRPEALKRRLLAAF
jgi:hypothetical protein